MRDEGLRLEFLEVRGYGGVFIFICDGFKVDIIFVFVSGEGYYVFGVVVMEMYRV